MLDLGRNCLNSGHLNRVLLSTSGKHLFRSEGKYPHRRGIHTPLSTISLQHACPCGFLFLQNLPMQPKLGFSTQPWLAYLKILSDGCSLSLHIKDIFTNFRDHNMNTFLVGEGGPCSLGHTSELFQCYPKAFSCVRFLFKMKYNFTSPTG